MLKTISAALIVASMLTAPAMAGQERGGAPQKPAAAAHQVHLNAGVRNANAKMIHRHHAPHHRHVRSHLRFHKKFGMHKTFRHSAAKSTVAHIKRG